MRAKCALRRGTNLSSASQRCSLIYAISKLLLVFVLIEVKTDIIIVVSISPQRIILCLSDKIVLINLNFLKILISVKVRPAPDLKTTLDRISAARSAIVQNHIFLQILDVVIKHSTIKTSILNPSILIGIEPSTRRNQAADNHIDRKSV